MLCQGVNGCGCAIQSTSLSITGSGTGADPWVVDLLGGSFKGSFYNFASSTERTAQLPSPLEGDLTWLDNINQYEFYDGTQWVALAGDAQSFNPTLSATTTNPNLGSTGSTEGWYSRVGDLVYFQFVVRFAGSGISQGSGTYHISVPFTPKSISSSSVISRGRATAADSSASTARDVGLLLGTDLQMRPITTTLASQTPLTHADIGVTWAAGDTLAGQVEYHAA